MTVTAEEAIKRHAEYYLRASELNPVNSTQIKLAADRVKKGVVAVDISAEDIQTRLAQLSTTSAK